ncbi:MAG: glycosyltransferase family 2 protein, partial [Lentisphaerae bacterium]|nr:glycosyltransferase family 2 protein [Lentisphaerota bacterium]
TRIRRCLDSIATQDYPHDAIEIVLADAGSVDDTIALVEEWKSTHDINLIVVKNDRVIAEFGKYVAFLASSGSLVCLLDADNAIVQNDWLSTAVHAFDIYPDIFGFESVYLKIPDWNGISNFLTACLHIDDPISYSIATRPREIGRVDEDGKTYRKYHAAPVYPTGANGFIYDRKRIDDIISDTGVFSEGLLSLDIQSTGNATFCRVDGYGVYHYYFSSFRQFLRKKLKRAWKHSTRVRERQTWVDQAGGKLYWHALLNLTVVWPLVYALYKAVRHREPLWL